MDCRHAWLVPNAYMHAAGPASICMHASLVDLCAPWPHPVLISGSHPIPIPISISETPARAVELGER